MRSEEDVQILIDELKRVIRLLKHSNDPVTIKACDYLRACVDALSWVAYDDRYYFGVVRLRKKVMFFFKKKTVSGKAGTQSYEK